MNNIAEFILNYYSVFFYRFLFDDKFLMLILMFDTYSTYDCFRPYTLLMRNIPIVKIINDILILVSIKRYTFFENFQKNDGIIILFHTKIIYIL